MAARQEYERRAGVVEVGHTGRGAKRKPIFAPTVADVAVDVDCARCGCVAVEARMVTKAPPGDCACDCHATWRTVQRGAER